MRKQTAVFFFAFLTLSLFARAPQKPKDSESAYRILEEATVSFDAGDYGNAMKYANQAKDARRAESEYETYILENALTPRAVRRVGTVFSDVLDVLADRDEKEAIAIINRYLKRYGKDYYNNNVNDMVSWIKAKAVYPEADYLIGKIYQLEGEHDVALDFYERARMESPYLDIPAESFDILYTMANLAKQQKRDEPFEQMLYLILDNDQHFKDKAFTQALLRTIDFDTVKHADRFFMLFRAEPNHSLEALYELGLIYDKRGEDEKALTCVALGTVEALTHMIAALSERDAEFKYIDFPTFLQTASRYSDIVEWGSETHVWDMMFQFAERVEKRGKSIFAGALYSYMSDNMPDTYWRKEAKKKLGINE
ncbi:MAG: hypothetical protein II684_01640 [Treponema sp.]|nr:hypothetical protein [Treponema sp.]